MNKKIIDLTPDTYSAWGKILSWIFDHKKREFALISSNHEKLKNNFDTLRNFSKLYRRGGPNPPLICAYSEDREGFHEAQHILRQIYLEQDRIELS